MSSPLHEVIGGTILMLLFASVVTTAEILMRRERLAAEHARKFVHLIGGLGCLLFPFMLNSWITVLIISSLFAAVFYVGETHKRLHCLCAVNRKSHGSLMFPMAVLMLFVLSNDRIWLYVSALLVLVLADTAAAMAGTRFGRILFRTAPGESKSLEGTLAFCLVGFFTVYVPILLLSDFSHLSCILTALLMAFLLAGLEAVSIGGTDNLFVPIATSFLLLKVPDKPPEEILFQCISLIGVAYLVWRINIRHTILQPRLLIIHIMVTYAAWSLGSIDWMLPLLMGFIIYDRTCSRCEPLPLDLTAKELLRPLAPPLIILFAANATGRLSFGFAPFLTATAIGTSLCIINRNRAESTPQRLKGTQLAVTALLPCALPLLMCVPIQGLAALNTMPTLLALCAATALIYNRLARIPVTPFAWNYAIPLISIGAALTCAGLQYHGIMPTMRPSTWMEVFRCQ